MVGYFEKSFEFLNKIAFSIDIGISQTETADSFA